MDKYTTQFDKKKELSVYHERMLAVLAKFQERFKTVFPSYQTLADKSNMCLRKAIYVIDELIEMGLVIKKPRFKTLDDGTRRSETNVYILTETYPQPQEEAHAPYDEPQEEAHAPYSSKDFKSKPLDLEEKNNARVTHEIFVQGMKKTRVPELFYKLALRRLGDLTHFSVLAFERALGKARNRFLADKIWFFPSWFTTVLTNENIIVEFFDEQLNALNKKYQTKKKENYV